MKNDGANDRLEHRTSASPTVRSALADVEHQTRAFVEQQPLVAVLMAVGLGFIVARVAARH